MRQPDRKQSQATEQKYDLDQFRKFVPGEKTIELIEKDRIKNLTNAIIEARNSTNTPVFALLTATAVEEIALNIFDDFIKAKIPVYRDSAMAANCIRKLADYWTWRESHN